MENNKIKVREIEPMFVPSMLLKQLYTRGSLSNTDSGLSFLLKNRLKDAKIKELIGIKINGKAFLPEHVSLQIAGQEIINATDLNNMEDLDFPLRSVAQFLIEHNEQLPFAKHEIEISFKASPFGKLTFTVEDSISECTKHIIRLPRDEINDYDESIIKDRQNLLKSIPAQNSSIFPNIQLTLNH
jgi:hydroxymethylglutaryl-CoA reductase (NADPH)